MSKARLGALVLVVATMIAGGPLAASALAKATGSPGYRCPRGAFCIYPGSKTWKTGPEKHGVYYAYGAHNLHNQYGAHLVYNNQYKVNGVVAGVTFCTGYNGTGQTDGYIVKDHVPAIVDNITPVNSITLWLYEYRFTRALECKL